MGEQDKSIPEGAADWHPMVEKTRITDPDSEDFGRMRVDSPEAEGVAKNAARRENEYGYPGKDGIDRDGRRVVTDEIAQAVSNEHKQAFRKKQAQRGPIRRAVEGFLEIDSAKARGAMYDAADDAYDAARSSEELDHEAYLKENRENTN